MTPTYRRILGHLLIVAGAAAFIAGVATGTLIGGAAALAGLVVAGFGVITVVATALTEDL